MPLRLPSGTSVGGPLKTNTQSAALRQEVTSLSYRSNYRLWFEMFQDFDAATLGSPWTARTATTAGTPTFAKVANEPNGVYRATLAANSEAETAGVDWADSLMLSFVQAGATNVGSIYKPVLEAAVRFPAALAANQTVVIGIATAFNATLTSISKYAWFRFNANNSVLIESKDGTTTNTAVAPTAQAVTIPASTTAFSLFTIDMTDLSAVRFFVDDNLIGTLGMLGLAATDKFQPLVALQKSTGVTTPTLDVDWINASCVRVGF